MVVEQLADTIADMGHVKHSITRDEDFLYLLETSLRLEFSSAVHIQREEDNNTLNIELRIVYESSSHFCNGYKISVKAGRTCSIRRFECGFWNADRQKALKIFLSVVH